jgi:perosamine synthetase
MDPRRRYWFPEVGYNYRMTNVAAAIGLAQLERIGQRLEDHRRVAEFYHRLLAPLEASLELPIEESWAEHVYWLYTIRVREGVTRTRDEVMHRLDEAGIETRPVFYPMHIMPPYREPDGSYPVAESVARRGISLPTNPLVTAEDVAYIAGRLAAILGA